MAEKDFDEAVAKNPILNGVNVSFLEGIQQFEPQYIDEYTDYCIAHELDLNEDSAFEFLEMKQQLMEEFMDN